MTHNIDTLVASVVAKLQARRHVIEQSDALIVIEIRKQNEGYDIKVKTTS